MLLFITIFLGVIVVLLLLLIIVLTKFSEHVFTSIKKVQTDLDRVSIEASRLSSSLNEFVQTDLHKISKNTSNLIGKLTDLTSDINNKSQSLNCLFKPFSYLTAKTDADSSDDESPSPYKSIPQILSWVASGIFIIKKTRELARKL